MQEEVAKLVIIDAAAEAAIERPEDPAAVMVGVRRALLFIRDSLAEGVVFMTSKVSL